MHRCSARIAALILLMLPVGSSVAAADGRACTVIESWHALPDAIRTAIKRATGPVAERGERYNANDVVSSDQANNRFLAACGTKEGTTVAIERGGRSFRIEMFHYAGGVVRTRWTQRVDRNGRVRINLAKPPRIAPEPE